MAKFILGAAMALVLTACGGGSSDAPPTTGTKQSLLVIGNSLAIHPVAPSLGWNHESGMAASDVAHDYVHLTATQLGIPLKAVRNEASIERNPADPINTIDTSTPMGELIATATQGIDSQTDVVVQLGDNVGDAQMPDFSIDYPRLLDAVIDSKPHSLVCTSRWWAETTIDAMMQAACIAHGGKFVYIGDIYPVRTDVIQPGEDHGVSEHPHDPSMAIIADRLLAAMH